MDYSKIGQFLIKLREYFRLSEDDVALRLSVSRQSVTQWEEGKALPDIETLVKLSEMYGITVNDIVRADMSVLELGAELAEAEATKQVKKIFTIGCGRWGTFLAWYLDQIGHDVSLYGRPSSARMKELMETRKNEHLHLSDTMTLVTSYDTIFDADYIVISISAQQLRDVAATIRDLGVKDKIIVLCMKGIEIETGRRLSQVVSDEVDSSNRVAVWLGPGHVQEFYRGIPNCMVIDSTDESAKRELIQSFSGGLWNTY
ncbi:MAG: helix-turn-helix domain-containing protein [Firmicutes bacterium]|nr:helix-turn-helix domain-containing protein [Bacillota bacterium]